jgi:hypothetical protein
MTRSRLSTLLGGLTFTAALAMSPPSTSSPSRRIPPAAPARVRHVPVVEEGCFVPPPEPTEVPPCDDARTTR